MQLNINEIQYYYGLLHQSRFLDNSENKYITIEHSLISYANPSIMFIRLIFRTDVANFNQLSSTKWLSTKRYPMNDTDPIPSIFNTTSIDASKLSELLPQERSCSVWYAGIYCSSKSSWLLLHWKARGGNIPSTKSHIEVPVYIFSWNIK